MRLVTLAILTATLPFAFASPAWGENPAHVRQLLITRACVGCDLTGADLQQRHLIGADLRRADLSGANLTEVNLEGADLEGANLSGANLTQAFLTNANLDEANLTNANLTQAKLYFANVAGATFDGIDLTRAEVVGTPISVGGQAPNE